MLMARRAGAPSGEAALTGMPVSPLTGSDTQIAALKALGAEKVYSETAGTFRATGIGGRGGRLAVKAGEAGGPAGRRRLGVGYSPNSGYDAATRRVKSWATSGHSHTAAAAQADSGDH
jgi:hypothetical protein